MKIWFCCCLLFCGYCLSILWLDDQYEVTYIADDTNKSEDFQYFGCLDFESFQFNRTEVDLSELRNVFHAYFQKMFSSSDGPQSVDQEFKQLLLNRTGSEDSVVIMRDNVCVILSQQKDLVEFHGLVFPRGVMFAVKPDTFDWTLINCVEDKLDQLIVLQLEHPYSDCGKSNSRFHCLTQCFKKEFRLSEYFYFGNETGPIHLNYLKKNATVRAHEDACFGRCSKRNCKLVYIYSNEDSDGKADVEVFRAKPMITKFSFNVQLVGLVCLILNVSFSRVLTVIRFIGSKVRNAKVKVTLLYLKLFILIAFLVGCFCLFCHMFLHYQTRLTNPTRKETTRNLLWLEPIHLVVCVRVGYIFSNYTQPDYRFDFPNEVPYDFMTMHQLEKATNGALNETIDEIKLDYQDRLRDILWSVTPKVLFKLDPKGYLQRCFQLFIEPDEPRYQMLLSISKLKIMIKAKRKVRFFLLAEYENLNGASFHFSGSNSFLRRVKKRSRLSGKCTRKHDYGTVHPKCTTERNCLEACIQRKFFNVRRNVTTGVRSFPLVIDRDQFGESEWKSAYYTKNYNAAEEIIARNKCWNQISGIKPPCVEATIEESVRINQPDDDAKEFELYYEIIRSIEEEPSFYKMVLDMLNIQSIFFGLTVYGLLEVLAEFVGVKFKISNRAQILALINLACLVGFSCHMHHVIDEVLNANLTYAQHYEIADSLEMPELIFCFDLNLNQSLIDANRKMTGSYLEQLTSQINERNIFESITYLNNKNNWKELDSNLSSTTTFEMETFFFLSKKWSVISLSFCFVTISFKSLTRSLFLAFP